MKDLKDILSTFILIFFLAKVVDFNNLSAIDISVIVLFIIYFIITIITIIKEKKNER